MVFISRMLLLFAAATTTFLTTTITPTAHGFVWDIQEDLIAGQIITFTERHLFASNAGPWVLPQGNAYIEIIGDIKYLMAYNESQYAGLGVFALADGDAHAGDTDVLDTCTYLGGNFEYDWVVKSAVKQFESRYIGTSVAFDPVRHSMYNRTVFVYNTHINTRIPVTKEAWYNVALTLCPSYNVYAFYKAQFEGTITFKNPYGFLPSDMYGLLPFQALRSLVITAVFVAYAVYYFKHHESVVGLHSAVLLVLGVAVAEFALWFIAYVFINDTGTPYCCPFPTKVVAALVLEIFRQSFSRVLLLVVALGYGIVRPRLLTLEWVFVGVVGGGYLISAIVAQVSQIMLFSGSVQSGALRRSKYYSLPEFIFDIVLLSWIYLALTNTMRILRDFKQTHKLRLYRALYSTIGVFVILFCFVTLLAVLAESQVIYWPWQLSWLLDALWESLNVAVLVAIAYICVPYDTSHLLAYAAQLPTFDPDEDGIGGDGGSSSSSDESDDYDSDEDNISHAFGGGSSSRDKKSSPSTSTSTSKKSSSRAIMGFHQDGEEDEIEDLDALSPIAGSSSTITTSSKGATSTSNTSRSIEMSSSKLGATRNALLAGKPPSSLSSSPNSNSTSNTTTNNTTTSTSSGQLSQAERHRRIIAAAEAARRSVRSHSSTGTSGTSTSRGKGGEYSLPPAADEDPFDNAFADTLDDDFAL